MVNWILYIVWMLVTVTSFIEGFYFSAAFAFILARQERIMIGLNSLKKGL